MAAERRKRRLTTSRRVLFAERVSRLLITAGGLGTVAAILLIFFFLVSVVFPLFQEAEVHGATVEEIAASPERARHVVVDEFGVMVAILDHDWTLRVVALGSGNVLQELRPFEDVGTPTAVSTSVDGKSLVFGFDAGVLRTAKCTFASSFPDADESEDLPTVPANTVVEHRGGVLQSTPEGKLRRQTFRFELSEPMQLATAAPVLHVAHRIEDGEAQYAAWVDSVGPLFLETEETQNWMTGEVTLSVEESPVEYAREASRGVPDRMLMTGAGNELLLAWDDGHLERIDARDPGAAVVAEVVDLIEDPAESIAALTFLVGNYTLIVGSSSGRVAAWFGAKQEEADTVDGNVFVDVRSFQGPEESVAALHASPRSRLLSATFESGRVEAYHVTSAQRLVSFEPEGAGRVLAAQILPKEDGILVLGTTGIGVWEVDFRHPEATLASLFRPVWYETYGAPDHSWQAEGATDDFEPKFGFVPLVYGTLKATFYSMIFGAPLAILAALFTSEFLDRRLRVPIKSTIEMMASLPSVVLGFLAGIVIAPVAQTVLPASLALFATVPMALLLGAHLWQLLPSGVRVTAAGWPRLLAMGLALVVGVLLALGVGPLVERFLFAGSVELWLDGQSGSAVGGWLFLLLPVSALVVAVLGGRGYSAWVRKRGASWEQPRAARVDLAKYGLGLGLVFLVALVAGLLLDAVGLDPRGSLVDTYDPRNALIVGFVMGFAIIPIIYSLAEDALASVPEHLRLASLGAGATPWQTAVRVILPTAMSGIFSAVMIGLGRAVGETMIVLMATGNTPIMELNMFNGFRTLSANIAVELPEAVRDSTHYRALFLAALVLFAMTFLLNTFAEAVRQRFRKRAYQL